MSHACRIAVAGDASVIVEFEERIAPAVNARAVMLTQAIGDADLPGVVDVVPAYRSVGVYFDPRRTAVDRLIDRIEALIAASSRSDSVAPRTPIDVPVCYGGEFGPDLGAVAAFAGIDGDEVVQLHTSGLYRVFMLGFAPGFAYMGSVDGRIAAPRKETPRLRVPAGSVAIAGEQTGVYPFETPGGWQIVGRTPWKPCDFSRPQPFLFAAGDLVRFSAIDRDAYEAHLVAASRSPA